jgi:uncharacterized protein (DUF433 family)
MADESLLKRITINPEIFGGKPIIRGMRISVELILSLLAQGETPEAILDDYPDLESEDIRACIAYAHAVIAHDSLDAVQVIGQWSFCWIAVLVVGLPTGYGIKATML